LRKVRPIISILAAPYRVFTLPGQSPRNGRIVLSLLRESAFNLRGGRTTI
jgi:hypothetical protein